MARDDAGDKSARRRSSRSGKSASYGPVYGAIDLGTNNCRMLLARKNRHGFRVVDAYSRIVKLGEGLTTSRSLSDDAMQRAMEALSVCAHRLARRDVKHLRAVATEACRLASNGPEFIDKVRAETGIKLEIISSEEEARLAVQGSLDLLDENKDAALVLDIGGGSTELCWVDVAEWRRRGGYESGGRPPLRGWATIPAGVVTLSEQFPEPDSMNDEEREAWYNEMKAYTRSRMKIPKGANRLRPLFDDGNAHLVGTSGTVTSVAGVHLNLESYNRNKVDGLWITTDEMRTACNRLSTKDAKGRAGEGCIGTDRAELVLAGCAILEVVMEAWPCEKIRVGDRGLREGLLLNLMRPKKRRGRRGARRKPAQKHNKAQSQTQSEESGT